MQKTLIAVAVLASLSAGAQAAEEGLPVDDAGNVAGTINSELTLTEQNKLGDDLVIADGAVLTVSGQTTGSVGLVASSSDTVGGRLTVTGGTTKLNGQRTLIQAFDYRQTGGRVELGADNATWASNAAVGGYYSFELAGGELVVNAGGRVWIGSGTTEAPYRPMMFAGGKLVLNGTDDNAAVVTTMTQGSYGVEGGTHYQALELAGTDVEVKGTSYIMSREVNFTGGSITVDEGKKLYLLSEKELNAAGKPVTETGNSSSTFTDGEFLMDGGTLNLGKGAHLIGRMAGSLDSGAIATDDFQVTGKETAKDNRTLVAFDDFDVYGGTITANAVTVDQNHTLGYYAGGNAKIELTGENASFTNNGTVEFFGLTMAENGKTAAEILGVEEVTGNGTFVSSKDNVFLTGEFKDGKFNAAMTEKDQITGPVAEGAYFDAAYELISGSNRHRDDLTAVLLAEYADVGTTNNAAEEAELRDYVDTLDDQIDTAAARGLTAYSIAYDAQRLINEGVEKRNMMPIVQGGGAWANVFYNQGAADSVYDEGYGYDADIYGGQIGFDWTASCGYRLGGVFTIGTADGNATGGMTDTDVDSDFYGFSLYASKEIERMTLGIDVGYTKVENDLSTNHVAGRFDDSIDADVWTIGTRADIRAWKGDVFSVTPHVGLRYTHVDLDDMGIVEHDTLNLIEMPVGVTMAADFEAAGWKVKPALDLSLVPQLGDKDVGYSVLGVDSHADIIDSSVFRTTLGVSAEYGNFGLGLDYRYGTSSKDRDDHSLNFNAVYRF